MKLKFGNLKHIALAEKGVWCECKHNKEAHTDYGYCKFDIENCPCEEFIETPPRYFVRPNQNSLATY